MEKEKELHSCRYCNNMTNGDAPYCSVYQRTMEENKARRYTGCFYWEFNPKDALWEEDWKGNPDEDDGYMPTGADFEVEPLPSKAEMINAAIRALALMFQSGKFAKMTVKQKRILRDALDELRRISGKKKWRG